MSVPACRHPQGVLYLTVLLILTASVAPSAVAPQFARSGPGAQIYGAVRGFPVGDAHTWNTPAYLVGSYSHFDAIFPARGIPHPPSIWNFRRDGSELSLRYEFGGRVNSLKDYLAHVPVTGLLIAKDDEILVERYQYGRTDRDRFTSASMAKSMVAMLLGIASQDDVHFSVDRRAEDFARELRHTAYGETTLRDLLHMSSGVVVNEGILIHKLYTPRISGDAKVLAAFEQRPTNPGARFHYSCGDSEALGLVLHEIVREPLAAFLSQRVWQPIGAEEDASWAVDTSGEEITCFGLNATLRDWGRVARLLASDGSWNGQQIIPKQWLLEATTIRAKDPQLAPGKASERFGYGYQLWILPGTRRMFAFLGADGQFILADPASKLFLVQTAVERSPIDVQTAETLQLWQAIVRKLGG